MEVVVSTPHGHADIDIVAVPPHTTLADLVEAVTGQAVPPTARVDGRVTSTSERLFDLDLCIGTTIDTHPGDPAAVEAQRDEVVRLVQLTGRGAGSVLSLGPGRHRIGSSRRLQADELDRASVETVAFELDISPDAVTRVIPGAPAPRDPLGVYTPMLNGSVLDRELIWERGRLSIGGRVFDLDAPRPDDPPARRTKPAPDGTIPFQRRTDTESSPRRTIVDAARDARRRSSRLWQRRRNDADALTLSYGIRVDGGHAALDLARHRGTALVGSDRFTLALARTLLLEAATLHGPADVRFVVATVRERAVFWNWIKWLPHMRRGDPTSPPDLLIERDELARWASAAVASSAPVMVSSPLPPSREGWAPPTAPPSRPADTGAVTVLVLDDIDLWSRRESPFQELLASPPPDLRFIALCGDLDDAPGRSTAVIEEVPPQQFAVDLSKGAGGLRPALFGSLARQHSRLAADTSLIDDIRPALTEIRLAVRLARRLAPLDDLDAVRRAPTPVRPAAPTLTELVDDAIGPGLTVAIGSLVPEPSAAPSRYEPAMVDLHDTGPMALVCPDRRRGADTIAAIVLGAASRHGPDRFAVLTIGERRAAWADALPHLAGSAELDDDHARLAHRVAHVASRRPNLQILVVIDGPFDTVLADRRDLVDSFVSLAQSSDNVHVVVTADHEDSIATGLRSRLGAMASIDNHGRGILDDGTESTEFIAVDRPVDAERRRDPATPLVVRTTTHERAMTTLERRLVRVEAKQDTVDRDDAAMASIAERIASRFVGTDAPVDSTGTPRAISLLPPPLPDDIELDALLERFPGDALPLGLVDRPERAENEAYWWQPGGDGSILAAGSPRSGLSALIDLMLVGIAGRVSADDLHVYAIEGLPQRRRALEGLPHVGDVVAPDDASSVERLIAALHAIFVERAAEQDDGDRPAILLFASDMSRIRRSLPPESVDDTLRLLAQIGASGPAVGIDIVAVGGRAEDLGELTRMSGDRLVGDIVDASDRSRFGVPEHGATGGRLRRCWSTASERLVQLAAPPEAIDAAIAAIDPEPAVRNTPARLLTERPT